MKKKLSILLTLAILFTSLNVAPISSNAATNQLVADEEYELIIPHDMDNYQTYIIKAPKSGYFYVELEPIQNVYDNGDTATGRGHLSYKIVNNYREYESWGGFNCNYDTVKTDLYGFAEGTDVELKLQYDGYSKRNGYLILKATVYHIKKSNFEKENNNSKKKANKVVKGKTYNALSMKDDTDWFVFTAPKAGKYKIYLTNTDSNSGSSSMDATVYASNSKTLATSTIYSGTGPQKVYTTKKLKKGQKIYIKTTNKDRDVVYKLAVK